VSSPSAVILGVTYGGHDTSAALMVDGDLVAAAEQERYDLTKHSRAFPSQAIGDCLRIAGMTIDRVDEIAYAGDRIRNIREAYLRPALENEYRIGFLIEDIERIRRSYEMLDLVRRETGFSGPINPYRHHLCHLASAYYPSGFEEALLVSHDGIGDIESSMTGIGRDGRIEIVHDTNHYPDSLGLLYSAITFYLGWRHHCDEGIIMGLACFGDPHATVPGDGRTYTEIFAEILKQTGSLDYEVGRDWISYHEVRDKWVSNLFVDTFGPKRHWEDPLTDHHRNIAAALQGRLEEVVLSQLSYCREEYGLEKIGIAGGVGLNCSLNGQILDSGLFDELFVQPASGDSGLAVGACYLAHQKRNPEYRPRRMHDFYCGYRARAEEIKDAVEESECEHSEPGDLYATVAERLEAGLIVGWYDGPAEFGPRALGNRSILCRPYPAEMKDHINSRVKFREPFRPFAPAVLSEHASEYFHLDQDSPHMLMAVKVRNEKRHEIPAVVHVDDSCRVQTVRAENNPRFRKLLEAFHSHTGVAVLLNTSFNIKGQPIVNTPQQAIDCYLGTEIDCLVLGDLFMEKQAFGT